MCSYVDEWSLFNKSHLLLKIIIEKILIYFTYLAFLIQKYIPPKIKEYVLYKILSKITYETYVILLQTYCI